MTRTSILFISLLACFTIVGCSNGPSDNKAAHLAFNYLSGTIPGIKENEISILGTAEISGSTIVLVQAGRLYCDMTVFRNRGRWEAGNMSCYGQFEPPEKAVIRLQDTFRTRFKTKVDNINKKLLYTTDTNNVRYNKHEFYTDSAVYHVTLLDARGVDCTNEHISSKLKPLIKSMCSDYETHKDFIYYDVSYDFSYYDSNGKLTSKHIVNEDICNNRLLCDLAQTR